jgi:mRNA deadenylase 3'-5' endonuclease subunit Ccr4
MLVYWAAMITPLLCVCGTPTFPKKRSFVRLPGSAGLSQTSAIPLLRVQQFNVLADGLAGMREDLGKFSRADKEVLSWDRRKGQILHELTQYNPDVITLQEVDHYYDFFLPELNALGYSGYFSPKPTSGCLEVSGQNDGCALFVRSCFITRRVFLPFFSPYLLQKFAAEAAFTIRRI